MEEAIDTYGDDAFFGRNEDETDIMDLLAGRYTSFEFLDGYFQNMDLLIFEHVVEVAQRHQTRALWEHVLELLVELKRLDHFNTPDLLDSSIPHVLLKLHRDDDAIAFAHYCLASRGEEHLEEHVRRAWPFLEPQLDDSVINSSKGEWPYPVQKDCRFSDLVDILRKYSFEDQSCGMPTFVMVPLAIKLRHVCVYRILSMRANAFLGSRAGEWLPREVANYIASFLTCGDEGAARYSEQLAHTNRLLDYIDEEYPHILPGVLNQSVLPPEVRDENGAALDEDQRFDVRSFFQREELCAPVLATLIDMLRERYD